MSKLEDLQKEFGIDSSPIPKMKNTGDFENIYMVSNNSIILEQNIHYGFTLIPYANSNAKVIINENIFQDKSNSYQVSYAVYAGVAKNMSNYTIKVNDNIVPTGTGALFRFSGVTQDLLTSSDTGPAIADTLHIHLTDNINTIETTNSDLIYCRSLNGNAQYLQYLTISGNSNFYRNDVTLQGMDIRKLPEGTSFYYDTDGTSSGGLINAPSGYNRYVGVETVNKEYVRLTYDIGDKFVNCAKDGSHNYEYTGTEI